ncbi:MAG: nucleotidyltransferase domain-containing protein [Candidatus Dormibacteraceae bacterium]
MSILSGTTRPLTGRAVAALLGQRSHGGVLNVLRRLTEHGLVDRQEAGSALLFVLNREHLAAPAVEVIAGMHSELLRRLRMAISKWEVPPLHASMFGSAARGDGDTTSDIDILSL